MTTIPEDRTTANSANEHAADHNAFAAAYNDQVRFLGADALILHTGSAAVALQSTNTPAWQLDASADEGVVAVVEFPADWGTANIDLIWAPTASASGNVRFTVQGFTVGDGEVLGSPVTLGSLTAAAPGTAHTVEVSRLVSGHTVVANETQVLIVLRDADHADDTYASDIGLIGVRLSKAS